MERSGGGPAISITWECLSNFTRDDAFTARLTLRNDGPEAIAPGWTLCFNTCRKILPGTVSAGFRVAHLNGDLFALEMAGGAPWPPGREYTVVYESLHWAISITDAPLGFYLLDAAGNAFDLGDPRIAPFVRAEQRHRMRGDPLPTADAAWRFEQNASLSLLDDAALGRITPRPLLARFDARQCFLGRSTPVAGGAGLDNETAFLRALLAALPSDADGARVAHVARVARVELETDPAMACESYVLEIAPGQVLVRGAGAHGVFNGLQSLAQLLGQDEPGMLPCGRVEDAPRFAYRGMMLDVARHFSSLDTVLRLLDCMAGYKLNRFHFHLTDDEGWRLAIAALPELTGVGARRGVAAPGEPPCLPPSFGSGPDPGAPGGSGFYTAEQFVAILRHARRLHIEVIPEFNMPGHARAAVEAMRVRHARLLASGDVAGAEEYLLSDPDDASVYESVQLWSDNVMCIALPSVERFIDTVVSEVAALYREAGVALRVLHTGGDEVPPGAWLGSPACRTLMGKRGWTDVRQLRDDFQGRCRAILARHGIAFAGWEETALASGPAGAGQGGDVYVWNSGQGTGGQDCASRLANAGHEVVLANAASLYFDFAYAKHPQEPGYYWAGFVDTREPFAMVPFDAALAPEGRGRIKGLQGQLWGENARSRERLEYFALPRLIGLAERAWSRDPGWDRPDDLARDWNEFANRLGQRELVRLDRLARPWAYRLPPPGAVVKERRLHANIALPGLAVHYTLDGRDPDARSARYTAPVALAGSRIVKLASVDTRGRASRIVTLNLEQP